LKRDVAGLHRPGDSLNEIDRQEAIRQIYTYHPAEVILVEPTSFFLPMLFAFANTVASCVSASSVAVPHASACGTTLFGGELTSQF
jgi:hypothetical protein